jgi:hydrogenase-4 component E
MTNWLDVTLAGIMLSNLLLLLAGRLPSMVRLLAAQGLLLAAVPIVAQWPATDTALFAVAGVNLAVKSVAFPFLLGWTARKVNISRELEPLVRPFVSLLAGVLFLVAALWLGSRLQLPAGSLSSLAVPVALFTILTGLFLIIARRKALTQVAGYLVLENGIFAFGASVAWQQAVIVEMGILLDIFVAVFVMGITIFQISRTFDSIDVGELSSLKDTRR